MVERFVLPGLMRYRTCAYNTTILYYYYTILVQCRRLRIGVCYVRKSVRGRTRMAGFAKVSSPGLVVAWPGYQTAKTVHVVCIIN